MPKQQNECLQLQYHGHFTCECLIPGTSLKLVVSKTGEAYVEDLNISPDHNTIVHMNPRF